MSQRLLPNTKWLWCVLVALWGPGWSPAGSIAVRTPPKVPSTVEAQAKFFQDFFSVQLSPYKIEFGHVCEDPNTWEQRYEKKDFKNHRDMGKVRWGDKQGGYGEHYWDLNHAGHADNHGGDDNYGNDDYNHHHNNEDDDGSYKAHDDRSYKVHDDDPYDEPSEQNPSYNSDYDPEKAAQYEENNRAKRAHPKIKEANSENIKPRKQKAEETQEEDAYKQWKPTKLKRHNHKPKEQNYEEDLEDRNVEQKELKQREVQERDDPNRVNSAVQTTVTRTRSEQPRYVSYEDGAGVRQHQLAEIIPAASSPRLFLEPSTGHVVDRATGQAYILQPITANYN